MPDKFMVQLFSKNTPGAGEAATAQKQAMESRYQKIRAKVRPEDCQRLEIQELYHTIFLEKGAGTLAEQLAARLEVDKEDQLDIGLDTFFNMLSENCSYDDVLNQTVLESAMKHFKNFDGEDEETVSEYDHWCASLVEAGEWVADALALFNRIGNFIALPAPCLIHRIEDGFVDVIMPEVIEKMDV